MTKERKQKLVEKYMTADIPALTDYQREWIRKETAHYIFVDRDENGNHHCHCDRCNKDIDLGKTKHKTMVKCPSCDHELTINHMWRNSSPETLDWIAIPKVLDKNEYMLRYVYANRIGKETKIKEVARGVFNINNKTFHPFELNTNGEWVYTRRQFFSEFNMYNFRSWCCLQADLYKPLVKRELRKLEDIQYFADYLGEFSESPLYAHVMISVLANKKNIYERLCKAGLIKLAQEDFKHQGDYWSQKLLLSDKTRINKSQLKLLRNNQDLRSLK